MSFFTEKRLPTSPFSGAYWHGELKAYGLPTKSKSKSKFQVEHVSVDWFKIQGRCDDYLNVNMRFDDTPLPRLGINGHLWMSLTPMEIQSAALAIFRAKGTVITGGLPRLLRAPGSGQAGGHEGHRLRAGSARDRVVPTCLPKPPGTS